MPEMAAMTVAITWMVIIFPIVLFGAVRYPSREMAPKHGAQGSNALRASYVKPARVHDVDAYLADVEASDLNNVQTNQL